MASVNRVTLIGNLGQDPSIRYMPNGDAVANLSLATTSSWKDKNTGEKKEETEWHRVVIYGRLAEIAGEYCKKGRPVYVEGRLKTRKWQDQSGQDKYTTEIVADAMQLLGGRDDAPQQRSQQAPQRQSTANEYQRAREGRENPSRAQPSGVDDLDDDIPF
jgi:single-strand DNA-binding protein